MCARMRVAIKKDRQKAHYMVPLYMAPYVERSNPVVSLEAL